MRAQAEIEINRPVAAVFPFVEEPDKLKLWVNGLVENTRLTPGETRPGVKFRNITAQANGNREQAEGEIIAFERNKRIQSRVVGGGFDATIDYQVTDLQGRTRVTQYLDAVPQNPLLKLVFALLGSMMSGPAGKRLLNDLTKLKEVVEHQG